MMLHSLTLDTPALRRIRRKKRGKRVRLWGITILSGPMISCPQMFRKCEPRCKRTPQRGCPFCLGVVDDVLNPAHLAILQHYFNTPGVVGFVGEQPPHYAAGQPACGLVFFKTISTVMPGIIQLRRQLLFCKANRLLSWTWYAGISGLICRDGFLSFRIQYA